MELTDNALHDAIARLRDLRPEIDADMAGDILRSVLMRMNDEMDVMRRSLLTEVAELGVTVANAREEIARLRHGGDEGESPIPDATDELDAIVEHTASATETILDACERIDALAGTVSAKHAALLQDQTALIFEACSFQDITGQRIGKVVATLKMVETRVARIIGLASPRCRAPAPIAASYNPRRDPLLNGPQASHAAMDQEAVDRLLII